MNLGYRDDKDRCYVASGMAIGLVVFDGEDVLSGISVDAEADSMVEFNDNFYFSGNPGLSAKVAWNQILRNFNLMSVMLISNVMCRSMVQDDRSIEDSTRAHLHDTLSNEGIETCSLEKDEMDRLFDKNFNYLLKVFSHNGVRHIAHDFAATLKEQRRLSRNEILEHLHALGML